ncbi:MAG: hypothetical protein ACM3X2_01690, partial [Pseudomonadota bacterium]
LFLKRRNVLDDARVHLRTRTDFERKDVQPDRSGLAPRAAVFMFVEDFRAGLRRAKLLAD